MFDVTKIQNSLFGLVGIRQPDNEDIPTLEPDVQLSDSGLYLDDVAPFDLQMVVDAQTFVKRTNPDFDTLFNTYLRNTQKSAISSILNQVFNKPDYIDRNLLFLNESPRNSLETFSSELAFMGYELEPSKTKDIGFKIPRVHCQFDFDTPTIDVVFFLFNSEKNEYLLTEDVTLSSSDQWVNLNWTVDSTLGDYKGTYYFVIGVPVVGEDKLRFQPWKRDYEDADCQSEISELSIERVLFNDGMQITNFNSSLSIETNQNIGLNPEIQVYSDYTDLIINNKYMFAKAVQLSSVIQFLNMVSTSMRSNRNERLGKEIIGMIHTYITGINPDGSFNSTGLNKSVYYEIETLRKELNKLREGYFGGNLMVDTIC